MSNQFAFDDIVGSDKRERRASLTGSVKPEQAKMSQRRATSFGRVEQKQPDGAERRTSLSSGVESRTLDKKPSDKRDSQFTSSGGRRDSDASTARGTRSASFSRAMDNKKSPMTTSGSPLQPSPRAKASAKSPEVDQVTNLQRDLVAKEAEYNEALRQLESLSQSLWEERSAVTELTAQLQERDGTIQSLQRSLQRSEAGQRQADKVLRTVQEQYRKYIATAQKDIDTLQGILANQKQETHLQRLDLLWAGATMTKFKAADTQANASRRDSQPSASRRSLGAKQQLTEPCLVRVSDEEQTLVMTTTSGEATNTSNITATTKQLSELTGRCVSWPLADVRQVMLGLPARSWELKGDPPKPWLCFSVVLQNGERATFVTKSDRQLVTWFTGLQAVCKYIPPGCRVSAALMAWQRMRMKADFSAKEHGMSRSSYFVFMILNAAAEAQTRASSTDWLPPVLVENTLLHETEDAAVAKVSSTVANGGTE